MPPERSRLLCLDSGDTHDFDTSLTIGRHLLNDLVVDLPEVSTRHAQIEWHDGGWAIRDLGSSNGTSVNERRIQGWRALAEGDVIRFARCSTWRVDLLLDPMGVPLPDCAKTRDLKAEPDASLVLVLAPDAPGEGIIRLLRVEAGAERLVGETVTGQGYVLLELLAQSPGEWVPDEEIRSALWGRAATRMARSGLHTLIGNTRKLLASLGAVGELIEKQRGRTRLVLPPNRVRRVRTA